MSSNRSNFSRLAEIKRCVTLIDYYADRGWAQRCERVFQHILRLWRKEDNWAPAEVTRKWWYTKLLRHAG